jgi:hypothetical protein
VTLRVSIFIHRVIHVPPSRWRLTLGTGRCWRRPPPRPREGPLSPILRPRAVICFGLVVPMTVTIRRPMVAPGRPGSRSRRSGCGDDVSGPPRRVRRAWRPAAPPVCECQTEPTAMRDSFNRTCSPHEIAADQKLCAAVHDERERHPCTAVTLATHARSAALLRRCPSPRAARGSLSPALRPRAAKADAGSDVPTWQGIVTGDMIRYRGSF